jgi:hypothetical protein
LNGRIETTKMSLVPVIVILQGGDIVAWMIILGSL